MSRTRTLVITLLGLAVSATAFAGPHERERREERRDERLEGPVVRDHRWGGPRAAPPAIRYERHAERRGYVWIPGNYEWQGGAYVWAPGRYEAERHGWRWREPRW